MKNFFSFFFLLFVGTFATSLLSAQDKVIYAARNLPGTSDMQLIRIDSVTGVSDVVSGVIEKAVVAPDPLFSRNQIIWDGGSTAYAIDENNLYSFEAAGSSPQQIGALNFEAQHNRTFFTLSNNRALIGEKLVNLTDASSIDISGDKYANEATYNPGNTTILRFAVVDGETIIDQYAIELDRVTPLGNIAVPSDFNDFRFVAIYPVNGDEYIVSYFRQGDFFSPASYTHLRVDTTTGQSSSSGIAGGQRIIGLTPAGKFLMVLDGLRTIEPTTGDVLTSIAFPFFASSTNNKWFISAGNVVNNGQNYFTEFKVSVTNDNYTSRTTEFIRVAHDVLVTNDVVRGEGPLFGNANNTISIIPDDANSQIIVLTTTRLWRVDISTGNRTLVREFAAPLSGANTAGMIPLSNSMRPPSVNDYVNALSNIAPLPSNTVTPDRNEDGTLDVGDLTTRQIETQRLP
jgi:hypothetical protein